MQALIEAEEEDEKHCMAIGYGSETPFTGGSKAPENFFLGAPPTQGVRSIGEKFSGPTPRVNGGWVLPSTPPRGSQPWGGEGWWLAAIIRLTVGARKSGPPTKNSLALRTTVWA